MRKTAVRAGMGLVLLLSACSESVDTTERTPEPTTTETQASPTASESVTPTETETSEAAAVGSEAAQGYVEALASGDPNEREEMISLSAPGSPAHAYAKFQAAGVRAVESSGLDQPAATTEVVDGAIESCRQQDCLTFADFETEDGKLYNFTIQGEPIAPRLSLPDGEHSLPSGGTLTPVAAYRSVEADAVMLAAKVAAGEEPVSVNIYSAEYVGPDGAQTAASAESSFGPVDVRAGANASVVVGFSGVDLGGTVYLDGIIGENYSNPWEVAIEVPPWQGS